MNNRIKISQSQLARLVEHNVNENTGGVGNLSTDDQPNIGMGSSNLVTTTHMDRPNGRLNIMGGTNPKQFKEGGRKESPGMSYKKEMMGEYKSSERLGGDNLVVIWPGKEEQEKYSGRLDEMGLELPDGWEPGMVCTMCECPAGSGMAMWINGCPCDEEEIDPFEWMNEQSMTYQSYHEPKDRIKEETPCKCTGGVGCCTLSHHCPEDERCNGKGCCVPKSNSTVKKDDKSVAGIRRSDRDKARRRPYSSKARDMRGSRDYNPRKNKR